MSPYLSLLKSQSFWMLICIFVLRIGNSIMSMPMQTGMVSPLTSFLAPSPQRRIGTCRKESFPLGGEISRETFSQPFSSTTGQPLCIHTSSLPQIFRKVNKPPQD